MWRQRYEVMCHVSLLLAVQRNEGRMSISFPYHFH
jgi:hypothetical protein